MVWWTGTDFIRTGGRVRVVMHKDLGGPDDAQGAWPIGLEVDIFRSRGRDRVSVKVWRHPGGRCSLSRSFVVHALEGVACGAGLVRPGSAQFVGHGGALDEFHELVEHDEFEAQFDAVDGSLEDGLDEEEVRVLGGQEGHVEEDDEDIDPEQVIHDLTRLFLFESPAWSEESARFPQI